MIELHKHGQTVYFDDDGVDMEALGIIRTCLYSGRFYEERLLEYIRDLGRRGVYLDVGSHIGSHTLFFALLCDSTHVYAFEPRRVPHDELARNIRANNLESKVTLCHVGLGSERKTVTRELDGLDVQIECVPLDEVVSGEDVAVVKMDVEGMEIDVLRGAHGILKKSKPAIFAEAHTEDDRRAIEDYLRPFDYAMERPRFQCVSDVRIPPSR